MDGWMDDTVQISRYENSNQADEMIDYTCTLQVPMMNEKPRHLSLFLLMTDRSECQEVGRRKFGKVIYFGTVSRTQ